LVEKGLEAAKLFFYQNLDTLKVKGLAKQ